MKIQLRKTSSKSTRKNRAVGVRRNILATSIATVAVLLASHSSQAAVETWTGATNTWNTAGNWTGANLPPISGDSLVFGAAGAGGLLLNNNLTAAAFNVAGITFNAGAAAFVIGDGTAAANVGNTFALTGGVTNNGTNLEIINNPFSMTAVQAFTTNAGGGNITLGGNISGAGGGINKLGAGNLNLSGANSYTGGTTVAAGNLNITGAGTLGAVANAVTVSGGTLDLGATTQTQNGGLTLTGGTVQNGTLSSSGTFAVQTGTVSAILSGAGAVNKSTAGTVTFSGANNYTGGTTVSAGTLNITGVGTLGNIANALSVSGGILDLGGTTQTQNGGLTLTGGTIQTGTLSSSGTFGVQSGTVSAVLAGTGSVSKTTAGTVTFSGLNTYTGTTTITGGVLSVSTMANGGAASGVGASTNAAANLVINGGTLQYTGAGASTDRLFTIGAGANAATIDSSGTGALNFTNTGAIAFTGAGNRTLTLTGSFNGVNIMAAQINDGPGGITTVNTTAGATKWLLTNNANSFSGLTTVVSGQTLQVGANGALGAGGNNPLTGTVVNTGGTLQVQNGVNVASEFLTINGTGVANAGALTVEVRAGLPSTGTWGGAILVGSTNSAITAGNGNTLTLTGGIIKNNVNLIIGNTAAGATTATSGTVIISGTGINSPGAGAGTFNSDVGYTAGTTTLLAASGYSGDTWLFNGAVVNANVAGALPSTAGDGGIAAQRAGLIMDADTVGNFPVGSYPTPPAGAIGGAGGSILNLGANQAVQFLASGPTSAGTSTINLNNFTLTIGNVVGGLGLVTPATFFGVINGTNPVVALIKDGTNTQVLTGTNTYIGGTFVNGGTLQVGNGVIVGSQLGTGLVTVNPAGTLDIFLANNGNFNNTVQVNAGGTVRGINTAGNTQNITQQINGAGKFIQFGAGTTVFQNINGYGGGTQVTNGGTLVIGTAAAGATAGQNIAANTVNVDTGATFQIVNVAGGVLNNNIDNPTAGTTGNVVSTPAAAVTTTLSGALMNSGAGSTLTLTQNGAGRTILTNAGNTYSGATRVLAGTLQVGNVASVGSVGNQGAPVNIVVATGGTLAIVNTTGNALANNITNGVAGAGTVVVNSANTNTLSGALTDGAAGTLALTQSGNGTTILTNAGNTYTGATTVSGGTLQIGAAAPASVGSVGPTNPINVGTGGTLSIFNIGGNGSALANNIQNNLGGAGLVNVASANANTYTLGGNILDGVGTLAVTLSGAAGSSTTLSGANAYSGQTTVNAGNTLVLGSNLTVGGTSALGSTVGGTVVANTGILNLNGNSVGAEALTIQGNGSGNGAITNTAAGLASFGGAITMPTTTTIGGATTVGNITLSGPIGGGAGAGIIKNSANTLTLSGVNNYSGATLINTGIVIAGDASALGSFGAAPVVPGTSSDTVVANNATLQIANGVNVNAEALTITGAGAASGGGTLGALGTTGGTSGFAGPITALGNATISANGGTLTLTGGVNKNGVNLTFGGTTASNAGGKIIVNTVGISGAAANSDMIFDSAATDLNAASSYNGKTFILSTAVANSGTLNTGVAGALPTGATPRTTVIMDETAAFAASGLGGSTLNIGGTALNPAGANQAIASLDGLASSKVTLGNNTLTIGFTTAPNVNGNAAANFAGAISGAGGIIKDDTSRQIFSGANTYTGTTNVNGGILSIQSNAGLGLANGTAAAGTVVATGATLQLQGGVTVGNEALTINGTGAVGQVGALTGNGGGINNFGGLVTLGSAATISSDVAGAANALNLTNIGTIVGGGNALTLTGVGIGNIVSKIDPTVTSITKTLGGTWKLSGANTYTGTTTVNVGTLQAGVATVPGGLGVAPTSGAFGVGSAVTLVNAGATLDLNGFNNEIGSLTSAVIGSRVDNTAAGIAMLTTGRTAPNTTFAGVIQNTGGALSLVKEGALTAFTLTAANTYTGGTTLNAGTLVLDNSVATGTFNGFGQSINTNNSIGTGLFTISNGTTVANTTIANTDLRLPNNVQVNGNFTITAPGTGSFVFNGTVDLQNVIRTITGTTSQSQPTFNGVISNGGLTFTTPTPGTNGFAAAVGTVNPYVAFIMNGAAQNTYTGLTTVNANAFLVLNSANVNKVVGNIQIDGTGVVELLTGSNQIADTSTVTVNSPGSQIIAVGTGTRYQGFELFQNSETIGTLNGSAAGTVGLGAGTLTVGSGTYNGAIVPSTANGQNGGGTLLKNTAGTLTLNGPSTYTGTTQVTAGTLATGNAKALGNANLIVSGGTLQNSTLGTTNAPLNVNIGAGNVSITGGKAAFIVGGADGGVQLHDQITTTGGVIAPIAGVLALTRTNGYLIQSGDKATLVKTGAAGVSGGSAIGTILAAANSTGLAAFSNTPLLIPNIYLYNDTRGAVLEATQGSFLGLNGLVQADGSVFTLTPNQQAVATTLDGIAGTNNNKTGVVAALDFINNDSSVRGVAGAAQDLDLLAPEELAAVFTIGNALSSLQNSNLQRHFEELRAEAGSAARGGFPGINSESAFGMKGPRGRGGKEIRPPRQTGNERWGTFLMGSGNFTSVGSTSNAAGYNLDTGGVTAGLEYKIAENLVVGIDAGYASTTARLVNGGKVDVDGGQFGIFASYFDMGFYVDAAVHGGVAGYKIRRTALGGVETASPGGSSFSAMLAGGYDWKFNGVTVGPTASFQYTNTRLDGFTENGGSLAPLTVNGHNAESTRTTLGVRAFYDANVASVIVRPELRLAWQHEYSDTSHALTSSFSTLGGNPFTVNGPSIGRDSLLIGAGVTVVWNSLLSTFVAYDGELARTNYESHSVSGGVRIKF